MPDSINLTCPLHESINKRIGDVAKNRANDFFEQLAGKLVVQTKLDLAGMFGERLEIPSPFKFAKWAVNKADFHQSREFLVIFRRKT